MTTVIWSLFEFTVQGYFSSHPQGFLLVSRRLPIRYNNPPPSWSTNRIDQPVRPSERGCLRYSNEKNPTFFHSPECIQDKYSQMPLLSRALHPSEFHRLTPPREVISSLRKTSCFLKKGVRRPKRQDLPFPQVAVQNNKKTTTQPPVLNSQLPRYFFPSYAPMTRSRGNAPQRREISEANPRRM